jgi:hypothetical protein
MSEVEAWCVKSPDGLILDYTCSNMLHEVKKHCRTLDKINGRKGYKVVKVKISEVPSE